VNNGILTQTQQPPAMPYGLLGQPTPVPLPDQAFTYDTDAADYIRRVQAADGQALELPVRLAIDAFVRGCKGDGIWTAIKASCILAGARTLSGALVPLAGMAPISFNFVSGDYDRKTGLQPLAPGSGKYIDTVRAADADPQNSKHMAIYASTVSTSGAFFGNKVSLSGSIYYDIGGVTLRMRMNASVDDGPPIATLNPGFAGGSRPAANLVAKRVNGLYYFSGSSSQTPQSESVLLFARRNGSTGLPESFNGSRLAFYSTGESLDLAFLDARVTTLINAFAAAL
jgi:hypothetical protein